MNRAPRRSWLRWAVIVTCVLCLSGAAAVALFIYISGRSSSGAMQNIGESWSIEELPKSLPEPGPAPRNLYRVAERRVLVDSMIERYRFYGPDCVVYQTAREAHHIFAVCGDRVPVGVASANVTSWQFEDDGLRRVSDAHVNNNGQLAQTVEILALSAITRLAQRQPPFQRGWAKSAVFDVNHPAIEPGQSERPLGVNAQSPDGRPPLLIAVAKHQSNVVQALLQAGASVSATDSYGTTALMIAASNDDLPAVERLIQAGANVNARDSMGISALMRAADVGNKDVVKRLLAAVADPNLRDSEGRTAAQRIAASADTEMRELLQTRVGHQD